MIYCCMGCTKRYPGCHDTCEEYIDEKETHERERAKIRKKREDDEQTLHRPKKKKQRSKWG